MQVWKDKFWTKDWRQRAQVMAVAGAVVLGFAILIAWIALSLTAPTRQGRQLHAERQAFVQAAAKQHDFDVWWRKASDAEDARRGMMQYVTSLCFDSSGYGWVGTEDMGIYRVDPARLNDNDFTHFTTQDGLGDDNAYALACDKQGRIWAGHLNHGVSVFNGKTWRNYDVLDGPSGERVFAIKVCPADGDVWIATNAGLTRYSDTKNTWTNYTTAQGLPTNQVQALAFDPKGRLYVGTQCDGIV